MLAEGRERLVFAHPQDPTRLLKVLKPQDASRFTRMTFGDLTQRYFPSTRWRPILKQTAEYTRLMLKNQNDSAFIPPVSHLYGFAQTTLGLACVTERVTAPDGANAPSLAALLDDGDLDDARLDALNASVTRLYTLGVRAGDLNAGNFVFGHRHLGPAGARQDQQWVVIDGFGDLHAIPARSWSRWTNTLGLDDCFKRMSPKIPLDWNTTTRQFERPQT